MPLKINNKQKTEDGNKLELDKVDLVFIFDISAKAALQDGLRDSNTVGSPQAFYSIRGGQGTF